MKPIHLMLKDEKYIKIFCRLGENTSISAERLHSLTEFVCHKWKEYDSIDGIRYCMYCQSGGKISCEHLPSHVEVLVLYAMTANYQARIWTESLVHFQNEVNSEDHGWFIDGTNYQLDITWMRCNPAPDEE